MSYKDFEPTIEEANDFSKWHPLPTTSFSGTKEFCTKVEKLFVSLLTGEKEARTVWVGEEPWE